MALGRATLSYPNRHHYQQYLAVTLLSSDRESDQPLSALY